MACCCELQNTLDVEVTQDALLDVEIGGSAGVLLQRKSVEITENGTSVVAPDDGFDGLQFVEINTNVPKRLECGDAVLETNVYNGGNLSNFIKKINVSCIITKKNNSIKEMFYNTSYYLTDIIGLDSWDTSNVINMRSAFNRCYNIKNFDVRNWDVSKVEDMSIMFYGCSSLQYIDVSNWDVSSVKNMEFLLYGCSSLQYIDVSNWDVSNVSYMTVMFGLCTNLKSIDTSNWYLPNINDATEMFRGCNSLRTIIGDKTLADVENGTVALRGMKVDMQMKWSPFRFSSILAMINGFADMTGKTAPTMTISSASYNNMYNDDDTTPTADVIAERQARIAAICAAKNWNFAYS